MKARTQYLLVTACFLLIGTSLMKGQSMIGRTKDEVRDLVQFNHKEFRRDNSIVNQQFNYLKYVNGMQTRTWILYFTDRDVCRSTKLVCDYAEYDEVIEQLNKNFERVGESAWAYLLRDDTIQVSLERGEWYFSVIEARK